MKPTRGAILVADGEVMLRNLVRRMLEWEGHNVLVAASGSEALELSEVHVEPIDLLITDVEMSRMDGITTYRKMSARRPGIKVLLISGGMFNKLELPPSLPFLSKPFDLTELHSRVNEILAIRRPVIDELPVILVVDHNEKRRDRSVAILSENGYAVLIAGTVEEAEEIADSIARIDLIVSGVIFPGHSGVHLAEHIEASERDISTLLISHFYPDLLQNLNRFSRQPEFLQNPFTADDLLTRVRGLLGPQARSWE